MQKGLRTLLLAQSSITNVVGAAGVYSQRAPQNASPPFIVLHKMSTEENKTLTGVTGSTRFMDFDIDCKATRYGSAQDLAIIVRDFIKDYTGTAGGETVSAVLLNGEAEDYEPPSDGSDIGLHVVTVDASIQWVPA